jgi:prepilin-type N-terminal cleavage/methylation domain-containing protein
VKRGFTLIELLVVISIILILTTLALAHFPEAAVRARVAKVRGDLRTLSQSLAAYQGDYLLFPPARSSCSPEWTSKYDYCRTPMELTSPTAYLQTRLIDPFNVASGQPPCTYKYLAPGPGWANGTRGTIRIWVPQFFPNEPIPSDPNQRVPMVGYKDQKTCPVAYALWSVGPAGPEREPSWVVLEYYGVPVHRGRWYNPTNGTWSEGIIARLSGGQG